MRKRTLSSIFITLLTVCLCGAQTRPPGFRLPVPACLTKDTVEVLVAGDMMMHSRQMLYPQETFLKDIAPDLKAADISIANLEFTLAGEPYSGYPSFSAPDSYASYLAGCGIDIFLTANNHILDKGADGAMRTLGIYRSMKDSVLFTGSAADSTDIKANRPLIMVRKGIRLAFVNFTYGTNTSISSPWPEIYKTDTEELTREINKAREAADFVIVLPHWGNEYELRHSASQEELATTLIKAGADFIIGAHPHVVQDIASVNGKDVFYSTGNCISNMSARNTRLGLIVRLRFVKDNASGSIKALAPEARFTWCTLPGTLTDSFATIFIDKWEGRRDLWKNPSDYDNMIETYQRIKSCL